MKKFFIFLLLISSSYFVFGAQPNNKITKECLNKLKFTLDESYGLSGKELPESKYFMEFKTFDDLKKYYMELGKIDDIFDPAVLKFVMQDPTSEESKCIQRFISLGCTKLVIMTINDVLSGNHPGFSELGYLYIFHLPLTINEIQYVLTGESLEAQTVPLDEFCKEVNEYSEEIKLIVEKIIKRFPIKSKL